MTPPIPGPNQGLNGAVAAELRAERAAQNMTVKDLAELADIPFASLRRYLVAERHIDVSVLAAVCAALATDPGELIARASVRVQRAETDQLEARRQAKQADASGAALSVEDLIGERSIAEPPAKNDIEGNEEPEGP